MTKKILIADDESNLREIFERFFSNKFNNYETLTAEDGDIALNTARQNFSDLALILMDTDMPKLKGYDVCKILRNEDYKGIIIGMTGRAGDEYKKKWKDAGATDYLEKPIFLSALLEVGKKYLKD